MRHDNGVPPDLRARLLRARDRRARLTEDPRATAYRLVNGVGDHLPGLAVDRFGDVLVAHLYDASLRSSALFEALAETCAPVRAIYVKLRPEQASRLSEDERLALAPVAPEWGEPAPETVVRENDVSYLVRPSEGLSVGLFLDMREMRAWVRSGARGRTVLNLFAYTCAFGVVAGLGGASRTLNLDVSKPYLAWGRQNYTLNGLDVDDRDFVFGDALDWVKRFRRRGERFGVVILDPPSFGTTRGRRFSAERDYVQMAEACADLVEPGGLLLAATNHAGITRARFEGYVHEGLERAGRRARLLRRWHEPSLDFPVAAGEVPYLKTLALALDAASGEVPRAPALS